MVKEYKTKELSLIFGISKQATDKKLQKAGYAPTKKKIKGNDTNHYYLTDEELNELIENSDYHQPEIKTNNQIENQQPESFYKPFSGYHQPNHQPPKNQQNLINSDTISQLLKSKDQIIVLQNQLISYAEQVGQVKLLTDSENNFKNEYLRLVQENAVLTNKVKELEEKNKVLQEENQKLKERKFFGIRY